MGRRKLDYNKFTKISFNKNSKFNKMILRITNISKKNIINLTQLEIPNEVLACINLGHKYALWEKTNSTTFETECKEAIRKAGWNIFFKSNIALKRGKKTSQSESMDFITHILKDKSNRLPPKFCYNYDPSTEIIRRFKNLPQNENELIKKLLAFTEKYCIENKVLIKNCDKNAGICCLTIEQYDEMVMEHLNDNSKYINMNKNEVKRIQTKCIKEMKDLKQFPIQLLKKDLIQVKDARFPKFHVLPKIHKRQGDRVPGRPICPGFDSCTLKLNKIIDKILEPVGSKLPNILFNANHLMLILEHIHLDASKKYFMAAIDIEALYPNLKQNICIGNMLKGFKLTNCNIPDGFNANIITRMLVWSFQNSFLEYKGHIYKQRTGITMGANYSVNLANIATHFEIKDIINKIPGVILHLRYIDDIFLIIEHTNQENNEEKLTEWTLGHFQHNFLKFTGKASEKEVNFLDINIYFDEKGKIQTTLYEKPQSKHQFLLYHSNHPVHQTRNIAYAQMLRILRNCSETAQAEININKLTHKLITRNYPKKMIEEMRQKAMTHDRRDLLRPKSDKMILNLSLHNTGILRNLGIEPRYDFQYKKTLFKEDEVWLTFTFYKTVPNFSSQIVEVILDSLNSQNKPNLRIAHKIYKNIQVFLNSNNNQILRDSIQLSV